MCRKISCNGADRCFLLNSTITIKCKSCDHDGHSNAFAYSRIYKSHRVGSRINFELKLNMYLLLLAGNDTRERGWFVRCNYLSKRLPRGGTIRSKIQWLIECPSLNNSRSNAVARLSLLVSATDTGRSLTNRYIVRNPVHPHPATYQIHSISTT